ncbi:2-iminoacetate synthase ThiH [Lacimicrobium alkaliphilum]|uniref:Thiamine biosynthesis protein ThiH n=1 Tax=Lacimicrobium alkaliphilum TaxID=1526571 RepID=A0ABQ1RGC9_9ALTE|nr:2-iminoacetate synthase ThiH [Lacimicrobium alkaliphilum]GGD65829.1 thiamine biosynthesis protein ThiH [Lacimicrobium alkaliphilum]
MSFVSEFEKYDWEEVRMGLYSCNATDVERALSAPRPQTDDFMALLSPAAEPYLEVMAQRAYALTRQRFGHTMQFFVPLYLSNLCANDCSYCGFSMSNKLRRKTLTTDEIEQECLAIKAMGFDSVLLVTGEHESKVGMDYFCDALPLIKRHFSYLAMEVQPLSEQNYSELRNYGLDAVLVYQETYNRSSYSRHHHKGKKTDFNWRLQTPDRLGKAGIDKIGLGALIGLDDWRIDSFFTACHLRYLQKNYWRTRYSLSFPRLRPCAGGLSDIRPMSDKQLVQLLCAWRILDSELELSLSTRESPFLRDHLLPLGITSISAGSRTQPGGYASEDQALEQFEIDDNRSPATMAEVVRAKGLQPVWTDWHPGFSR